MPTDRRSERRATAAAHQVSVCEMLPMKPNGCAVLAALDGRRRGDSQTNQRKPAADAPSGELLDTRLRGTLDRGPFSRQETAPNRMRVNLLRFYVVR